MRSKLGDTELRVEREGEGEDEGECEVGNKSSSSRDRSQGLDWAGTGTPFKNKQQLLSNEAWRGKK